MGLLDKLLKREAGKIISGMVDQVVDTVRDSAKEALNQSGFNDRFSDVETRTGGGAGRGFEMSADEESCCGDSAVIEARIRKVLAENFSDCELRENVDAASIGVSTIAWSYSYGIFRDGMAVGMINILSNQNDYKKKIVLQSKQACADQRIGYVHFLSHLPNRYSYIENQIKKILTV